MTALERLREMVREWRAPCVNYRADNSTDVNYDPSRIECAAKLEALLPALAEEQQVMVAAVIAYEKAWNAILTVATNTFPVSRGLLIRVDEIQNELARALATADGRTALAPYLSGLKAAIEKLNYSADTHRHWRDWLVAGNLLPHPSIGDADYHQKALEDYEEVLGVLNGLVDMGEGRSRPLTDIRAELSAKGDENGK